MDDATKKYLHEFEREVYKRIQHYDTILSFFEKWPSMRDAMWTMAHFQLAMGYSPEVGAWKWFIECIAPRYSGSWVNELPERVEGLGVRERIWEELGFSIELFDPGNQPELPNKLQVPYIFRDNGQEVFRNTLDIPAQHGIADDWTVVEVLFWAVRSPGEYDLGDYSGLQQAWACSSRADDARLLHLNLDEMRTAWHKYRVALTYPIWACLDQCKEDHSWLECETCREQFYAEG